MASNQAWRGCSSSFEQPLGHKEELEAQQLMKTITIVNSRLPSIEYRSSEKEIDILRQVFKWDHTPCKEVFKHGFRAKCENKIPNECFYNLCDYVHDENNEEALIDSRKKSKYGFISTTVSNSWCPPIPYDSRHPNKEIKIYRYEIFAPGGIWITLSLGDLDLRKPKRYDEVAFVLGIAPQYIRSAQQFKLKANPDRTMTIERVDHELIINDNFNPQSNPLKLLRLELPICDYIDEKNARAPLQLKFHRHNHHHEHGQGKEPHSSSSNDDPLEWYSQGVTNIETYLDAAFRSSVQDEAYYIQKKRVAHVNYDPTGNADKILDGPFFFYDMFHSLKNMPFGHHGVDCSFASHNPDEAYIFCGNLCALINYAPQSKNDDKILQGPTTIACMFPFLKGTIFEGAIDAAFEATTKFEAFFFKGNQCARVKYYGSDPHIISIGAIFEVFPSLKGKVHEEGVDAAHASHLKDEVYLFHYNTFAQINYVTNDVIYYDPVGSQGKGIASLFPLKNRGVDLGTSSDPPPKA